MMSFGPPRTRRSSAPAALDKFATMPARYARNGGSPAAKCRNCRRPLSRCWWSYRSRSINTRRAGEPPYTPRLPEIRRLRIAATISLNVKSRCSATRASSHRMLFERRCCRRLALLQSYQSPRRLSLTFPTVREHPHPRHAHRQRAAFMIPRRRRPWRARRSRSSLH